MTATRTRRFMPGDRVVAKSGTSWDHEHMGPDDTPAERDYFRLHGHHGHVVDACPVQNCYPTSSLPEDDGLVHVIWEGTHDGRAAGPTDFTSRGHVWHMGDDEIEHAD